MDNVRINKRANGGGPVTWEDVVAICRDSLAGVSIIDMGTGGGGVGATVAAAGQAAVGGAGQMKPPPTGAALPSSAMLSTPRSIL